MGLISWWNRRGQLRLPARRWKEERPAWRVLGARLCLEPLEDRLTPSNLVINGSFEVPTNLSRGGGSWDYFRSIEGWTVSRGPAIEIQRIWTAAAGSQYAELDSHPFTSGTKNASSAIFQDLATEPGQRYELTFAFSPRPGVADNRLEVRWDGQIIADLRANGTGLSNTRWEYHTYSLTATGTTTRLEFGDRSVSDTYGTFLDDVRVTAVPPAPEPVDPTPPPADDGSLVPPTVTDPDTPPSDETPLLPPLEEVATPPSGQAAAGIDLSLALLGIVDPSVQPLSPEASFPGS